MFSRSNADDVDAILLFPSGNPQHIILNDALSPSTPWKLAHQPVPISEFDTCHYLIRSGTLAIIIISDYFIKDPGKDHREKVVRALHLELAAVDFYQIV